MAALFGLLKPHQKYLVNKISQLTVNEENNAETTESNDDLSDPPNYEILVSKKISKGSDSVDKRLR